MDKLEWDEDGFSDSDVDGDSSFDDNGESDSDTDGDGDFDDDGVNYSDTTTEIEADLDINDSEEMNAGPDFARGYWVITGSEGMGEDLRDSTILFTSTTVNSDGTISLQYRMDLFLLERPVFIEAGSATYYPQTGILSIVVSIEGFGDTAYESNYFEDSDMLIAGSWNQDTPGVFTAERQLDGYKLNTMWVDATTERSSENGASMINDGNFLSHWSSRQREINGQTVTLVLSEPTTLSAIRLIAFQTDRESVVPHDVTVYCYDRDMQNITSIPLSFVESPFWQGKELVVDQQVAILEMSIDSVSSTRGDWLLIQEVELFGDL